MTINECPICGCDEWVRSVEKHRIKYLICSACDALYAENWNDEVVETANDAPEPRSYDSLQSVRLQRLAEHLGRRPRRVLVFGCGHGEYVRFLEARGIDAVGIDRDTPVQIKDIPDGSFDAVNMVEIIEHLMNPGEVVGKLFRSLKSGGIIYVESSFMDHIGDPALSGYVDPRIGHCCVHSRRSMDFLRWRLRAELKWINDNVAVFRKAERV